MYHQVERLEILLSAQTVHSGVIRLLKKRSLHNRFYQIGFHGREEMRLLHGTI
jgi:hypothetical protein